MRVLLPILALLIAIPALGQESAEDFSGLYRLKSEFQGPDMCLESNDGASDYHAGAAFMDTCQDVSGQLWTLEPVEGYPEYVHLKSMWRGDSECLNGNADGADGRDGAAFMDACADDDGHVWRLTPISDGAYRLKNAFDSPGACLESNDPDNGDRAGAAHKVPCVNASGQFWHLERVDGSGMDASGMDEEGAGQHLGDFPLQDLTFEADRRYWGYGGTHYLVFQGDGNLVVYTADDQPIWALNDSGRNWRANTRAVMQDDGNLVTYAGDAPIWASDTWGNPDALLVLLEDGTLQVVVDGGGVLWSSR